MEKSGDLRASGLVALVRQGGMINAKGVMIISCPACATRYVVPDTAIGVDGRTVRCAKCKHSWFQEPDALDLTTQAEAPAEAPATAPPPQPPSPAPTPAPQTQSEPAPDPEPSDPDAAPSVSHWRTQDSAPPPPPQRPQSQGVDPHDPVAGGIAARALRKGLSERKEPEAPPQEDERPDAYAEEPEAPAFDAASDPLADHAAAEEAYVEGQYEQEDDVSQFDYVPPFTARRNPLKMWTIAAAAFAALATGTVFAVNYYGLPDWFPVNQPTFGIGKPNLTLDFPTGQQRTEELETGEQIFRVRGTINNSGRETVSIPNLLVVFSDERERQVGTWPIVPSKGELAPGESLVVTEAIADVPPAAKVVEIGWAPN